MTAPGTSGVRVLPLLFVIQFLSWSAMFCLWVYAVPTVAEGSEAGANYLSAATTVAICFSLYALFGTILSFAVPGLIRRFDAGRVHGCALLAGGGAIAALGLHPAGLMLLLTFASVGIAWASLSSIPYALVSATAPEGQGARRVRLFAFSTVLPQVATTLILAMLAPALSDRHASLVMFAGGAAMALAGVIALLFHRRLAIDIPDW